MTSDPNLYEVRQIFQALQVAGNVVVVAQDNMK